MFGLQDLVGQSGKGEVEVVFDLGVLKTRGFGEGGPDAGQIGEKGLTQVGKRSGADVVADDEEE